MEKRKLLNAIEDVAEENNQFRLLLCSMTPCCMFCAAPYQLTTSCQKMTWRARIWNIGGILIFLVLVTILVGGIYVSLQYSEELTNRIQEIYDTGKEIYDTVSETLDEAKETLNDVSSMTEKIDEMENTIQEINRNTKK